MDEGAGSTADNDGRGLGVVGVAGRSSMSFGLAVRSISRLAVRSIGRLAVRSIGGLAVRRLVSSPSLAVGGVGWLGVSLGRLGRARLLILRVSIYIYI